MNQAQLAQIVATVVAVMQQQKVSTQKASHKPVSTYKAANKFEPKGKIKSDGRTARQLANEVAVAKAFKKLGINVTPRVDVFSYKEWEKRGMVPKGQKGTFVKGVGTMFHSGQVVRSTTFDYLNEPKAQEVAGSFPA